MKIGVIGGGVVGQATARTWLEHAEDVRIFDTMPQRRTHELHDTLACDLIFVCLPTPQKEGGMEADCSCLVEFFSQAPKAGYYVLRSTVPIGTTRRLRHKYGLDNLIHSPEFLTARCAYTDAQTPARNIIGGFGDCAGDLHKLYFARFPGVPIYHMSSDESEAVKLLVNGFFAVKVAYWNEVYSLIDRLGLDFDCVMAGVLSDGRIAHAHTRVPGPDGKRGFGGACLPKDLANLVTCIQDAGLNAAVTLAALNRNACDRCES